MDISFYRGDNHKVRFKFKNFTGTIDNVFFTVKCANKYPRIKKKLNEGITLGDDGYYCIEFLPEDTDKLDCTLKMVYDIEIIVKGEKKTVAKGDFILMEDVTTPDCEG